LLEHLQLMSSNLLDYPPSTAAVAGMMVPVPSFAPAQNQQSAPASLQAPQVSGVSTWSSLLPAYS
jgi:hypothetical protein